MAQRNRTTLKGFFETGDKPTEEQFSDLIDSNLNKTDDTSDDITEGSTNLFTTSAEKSTWNNKQDTLVADTDYLTPDTASSTYEPKKGADDNFVTDAEKVVIGNTSGTNTGDQDLSGLALKSSVLELDNTEVFTPDGDYEPATKKYVDDNAGGAVDSVNGETGTVVLDADDIDDTSTTNKFVTASDLTTLANTSGTNTGDQDISGIGNATEIRGVGIDSSVASPSDGKILVYRSAGSDWVMEDKPAGGSNPALNDVTDVDIVSVADNDLLAYDSTSGDWINQSPTEAGFGAVATSNSYTDLDDKPTIPDELSDLSDDSTHRLVTDTEKSTWNGKQDALTADTDYLTPGTASSTYEPIKGADDNYVTDAEKTVIGNTSGTNTGDQTSIVGITGTKSEFDTAVTDGNILFDGDITQYTDEMAQDAVGGIMTDSSELDFTYNDTTPSITATIKSGSIDESKLDMSVNASLDLADSAIQSGDLATVATTGAYSDLTGNPTIPDSLDDLTGSLDDISDGTTYVRSENNLTDTLKNKLDGIEAGAEVNTVDSVNGDTGAVVLDADDIDDTSTTNKFVTATDITNLGNLSGTNSGDVTVTDTNSVDLSLTGQALSADVLVDDDTLEIDATNGLQVKDSGITIDKIDHSTNVRTLLTSDATYYVATTGNDSTGDGSSGSPWATIQHAIDYLVEYIDLGVYDATIQLADGTYTDSGNELKAVNGSGTVTIQGNTGDEESVIINSSGTNFTTAQAITPYVIQYVKTRQSGSSKHCVQAMSNSVININNVYVDDTNSTGTYTYIFLSQSGSVVTLSTIEFSGACAAFLRTQGGVINYYNGSITLTGTCSWSSAFYLASEFGGLLGINWTFSGSATGKRYSITINSYARIGSASTSYFPGDTSGTSDATSHYG